jgi:cytochrome c-type biogenesis protein CcmE
MQQRDNQTDTQTGAERQNTYRKRLTSRQIKLLVGGIIVAVVVGYLIVSAARGSAAYYLTVQELVAQGPSTRTVRVAGTIDGGSIAWDARALQLEFELLDESGRLPVFYHGPRPDMFRDGAEAVVEGQLTLQGVFEARTLVLKCPSKYEEGN